MADKPANKKTSSASKQAKASKGTSNSTKKPAKKNKIGKKLIISLVIIAILAGGYFIGLLYEDKIDEALGFRKVETFNPGDKVFIGGLNIHFIDVGQGDACLVEFPDGRAMLIDAGENDKEVREKLTDYMDEVNESREAAQKAKIEYFDYVVVTHSDSDHIGSMAYILGLYPAATFYRPNQESTYSGYTDPALSFSAGTKNAFWAEGYGAKNTLTYKNALEAGYKQHDNFKEGIVTNPYDDTQNCIKPNLPASDGLYYEVNFYGPIKATYSDSNKNNNYSPIIIIEYKNRRIALSGDAEKEGERDFVAAIENAGQASRFYKLKSDGFYADIIKLGHHGSDTSSTDEYFNALTSRGNVENIYIVISYGTGNKYGHPNDSVIKKLDDFGFKDENILATTEKQDIFFALNFYEGEIRAVIANARPEVSYPVLGGIVRYRNIGIAIIVVFALILLPASFIKKAKKQVAKK